MKTKKTNSDHHRNYIRETLDAMSLEQDGVETVRRDRYLEWRNMDMRF